MQKKCPRCGRVALLDRYAKVCLRCVMDARKAERGVAHQWIRTVPTDGRWCKACGLAEARWIGESCPRDGRPDA